MSAIVGISASILRKAFAHSRRKKGVSASAATEIVNGPSRLSSRRKNFTFVYIESSLISSRPELGLI